MTVAFQGEKGAYSELASNEYFGSSKRYEAVPEFADVYSSVVSGKTRYGILPIENSMAGSIHQNFDLLLNGDVFIIGEIFLMVSHYLIGNKGIHRRRIKRVYSHPQALAQCKKYLSRFPDLKVIPVSNTAGAVKKIKKEKLLDAAAIASMQAAIDFDMTVLAKKIEDNHNNRTRFIILSKKPMRVTNGKKEIKTSIVFATKNIPGALFKALSAFALRDIDLYKIESRPFPDRHFEYMFYLDFKGDVRGVAQQNALNHLREITTFDKILGSYYVGNVAHPAYKKRD